jgi:hypothetical protein
MCSSIELGHYKVDMMTLRVHNNISNGKSDPYIAYLRKLLLIPAYVHVMEVAVL